MRPCQFKVPKLALMTSDPVSQTTQLQTALFSYFIVKTWTRDYRGEASDNPKKVKTQLKKHLMSTNSNTQISANMLVFINTFAIYCALLTKSKGINVVQTTFFLNQNPHWHWHCCCPAFRLLYSRNLLVVSAGASKLQPLIQLDNRLIHVVKR